MPFFRTKTPSNSSSSRRLTDDGAYSEIDLESLRRPGLAASLTGSSELIKPSSQCSNESLTRAAQADDSNPFNLFTGHVAKLREYETGLQEISSRAQLSGGPLFIPAFTNLRRTIVEHLTEQLQQLEREISIERSTERVEMAVTLLRQMGRFHQGRFIQCIHGG